MNNKLKEIDVCIIGDGFAGMNVGRLLKKNNVNCEIFSSGISASQLWVGTVDFLKSNQNNLEKTLEDFKRIKPNHPYTKLDWNDIEKSFSEFFSNFPQFKFFKANSKFSNDYVLTTLGNLKTCVGIWKTIFNNFSIFKEKTITCLIDFLEFNNSTMHLVAKSLKEKFPGQFYVLEISFIKLIKAYRFNLEENDLLFNLTENKVAQYFDKFDENIEILADFIKLESKKQLEQSNSQNIKFYLFPPIVGIQFNENILENLSKYLNVECKELVAFSPSLMSKRLIQIFETKLSELSLNVNKGKTLIMLEKEKNNVNMIWNLTFSSQNGEILKIRSKYIVFATGSLFQMGLFSEENQMKNVFSKILIKIPNDMSNNYELWYNNRQDQPTGLFVCGAALFAFMGEIAEEEEIEHSTGLGLVISSGMKVANEIIKRLEY
jgi:anaerobic glycerol-3-phosphate dehydrogenase